LEEHNRFGIPRTNFPGNRTLIVREGYTLAHNNVDLIADWVSFRLTRGYVQGTETRPGTSAFKPDPALPAGRRAERADYKGWQNIYDRGHQAASADQKGRGTRVIRESFMLSNMTPQASRLNQHSWRLFEAQIQDFAEEHGEVWVVTGPLFLDEDGDGIVEYSVIGDNQVAVPTHYYKIVLRVLDDGTSDAMAVIVPNEQQPVGYDDFLVSIDSVEAVSGYDFFPGLDDDEEDPLEALIAEATWTADGG
jgi:endonuclease G